MFQKFFRDPGEAEVGEGARIAAGKMWLSRILVMSRPQKIQGLIYVLSAPPQDAGCEVVRGEMHRTDFF